MSSLQYNYASFTVNLICSSNIMNMWMYNNIDFYGRQIATFFDWLIILNIAKMLKK